MKRVCASPHRTLVQNGRMVETQGHRNGRYPAAKEAVASVGLLLFCFRAMQAGYSTITSAGTKVCHKQPATPPLLSGIS